MGRPAFPSRDQIVQLRAASKASAPENRSLKEGKIAIDIPPQGLVVIKVQSRGAH
jgi:xylan 1,4-beta-xylosidase